VKGRTLADATVAASLYKAATGYEYEEDHVTAFQGEVTVTRVKKYKGPDSYAAVRWLSVRQKNLWTDSQKVEITQNINITKLDLSKLDTEELMMLEKIGLKQLAPRSNTGIPDAEEVSQNEE
jgi:hypothetical protein